MGLETGQVIEGKYRIVRLLGEGGMGAVYEGENVRIHRKVAIKVLHAGVAENADAVAALRARGAGGGAHRLRAHRRGARPRQPADGDRFMVMEYLDGESLSERIQGRGRLTPHEVVPDHDPAPRGARRRARRGHHPPRSQAGQRLSSCAARRAQADFVKILDFGISKFNALTSDSGMSMTRTGAVMGTPYYMSPEQAKGAKDIDHRTDLYSVGVILYEAVTGRVPFNAETFNELIFKIVLEASPAARAVRARSRSRVRVDHAQGDGARAGASASRPPNSSRKRCKGGWARTWRHDSADGSGSGCAPRGDASRLIG